MRYAVVANSMCWMTRFAISLEPNNENVKSKLAWATERRGHNEPTVPAILSSVGYIRSFNKFYNYLPRKYSTSTCIARTFNMQQLMAVFMFLLHSILVAFLLHSCCIVVLFSGEDV